VIGKDCTPAGHAVSFRQVRKELYIAAGIAVLLGLPFPAGAEGGWIYRDLTGKLVTIIHLEEETHGDEVTIHSTLSDGDLHNVEMDASRATFHYYYESPERNTAYSATREGNEILLQGTLKGQRLSRRVAIDSHPWFQSMEWSLQPLVVSGSSRPLVFWVVNPFEGRLYLMQAREEQSEEIPVDGRTLEAMRVRVRPWGILSAVWSSLYWFRPSDGAFLRYEAVRGLPGTPKTVVELIKEL
jgi:hypothetical protein